MPLRRIPTLVLVALACLAYTGSKSAEPAADYRALLDASLGVRTTEATRLFEQAVQLRVRSGEMDESQARVAAHQYAAEALAARRNWLEASTHAAAAQGLAEKLQKTDVIITLHLARAGYLEKAGDITAGISLLDRADALLRLTPNPAAELESALLRAALWSRRPEKFPDVESIYQRLLALKGVDVLRVELHRARHTRIDRAELYHERWTRIHQLATAQNDSPIMAEALDHLGQSACSRGNFPEAARHFSAAEQVGISRERSVPVWLDVIQAYSAVDDRPRARRALDSASALVNETREPGRGATLHEARGELLAREGDFAAAYRALRRANELRRAPEAQPQLMPFTRITPGATKAQLASAGELAAARSSLREVELERARLQQRQFLGLTVVSVLVTALLGLAYAYKRRTAAALAAARDNAELRADRTHWQMLRYQLNPHFLFNALSSIGGLVVTDPPAAGRVIDRLSEFCQLALKGAHEGLRSLAEEFQILRAYLDVERAGHGEGLEIEVGLAPEAASLLVPPLLLQPLVENALKYGGETSDDCLKIAISARRSPDGASLVIEVANTGRWIEREGERRQRDAVGLANVRERLARFGASSDALTIMHADGWVRAQLRLPAHTASAAPTP